MEDVETGFVGGKETNWMGQSVQGMGLVGGMLGKQNSLRECVGNFHPLLGFEETLRVFMMS